MPSRITVEVGGTSQELQAAVREAAGSLQSLADVVSRTSQASIASSDRIISSNQAVSGSFADELAAARASSNGIVAAVDEQVTAVTAATLKTVAANKASSAEFAAAGRAAEASAVTQAAAAKRASAAWDASTGAVAGKGKTLALGVGGLVAVGADMDMKFRASMEMIHTQAGATQAEVNNLIPRVEHLARMSPQGPEALAKGLFHLESIGLHNAKAMDALKTAEEGAAVGGADLEQTATALGSAWLVNIKGGKDLHNVMATLNATVGAGNMRMGDLVDALGQGLLPAAKNAGLGLRDAMGAMAVFTDEGYPASSAAAQLATSLHFLYDPTTKASGALASIGMTSNQMAQDMHKPHGLLLALTDLHDHLKQIGPIAAEQVLGEILPGGRGRILLTLMNQLDRYQMKLGQIGAGVKNFSGDVAATQETDSYRLHTAWSSIEVDLIHLGAHVLPSVTDEFGKFARVLGDPNLDSQQKLDKLAGIIAQSVGKAVGGAAQEAGQLAPEVAKAFVSGFLHGGAWADFAAGAWIVSKTIGWKRVFGTLASESAVIFAGSFTAAGAERLAAEQAAAELLGGPGFLSWRSAGALAGRAFGIGFLTLGGLELGNLLNKEIDKTVGGGSGGSSAQHDLAGYLKYIRNPLTFLWGKEADLLGIKIPFLNKREGGVIDHFADGGLMGAYVSPGEMLSYGGQSMMVPGQHVGADSVFTLLPVGTAVFTDSGQSLLAAGYDPMAALALQAPHFGAGGLTGLPPIGDQTNQLTTPPGWHPPMAPGVINPPDNPRPSKVKLPKIQVHGGVFNWTELEALAKHAGFPGKQLPVAAAVSEAESGGDPKKVSPTDDYGLWQINHAAHPSYSTRRLLDDVYYNAKAAHDIWTQAGNSWLPWTTYQSGAYLPFLQRHGGAAPGSPGSLQFSTNTVPGPPRAGFRTLRGSQVDVARLTSALIASPYSTGFQAGQSGAQDVTTLLPDILNAARVPIKQTTRTVPVLTDSSGITLNPKTGGTAGVVAAGTTPYDGKPVANWIVPILTWARRHGWHGGVTSGYRTPAAQMHAAQGYGLQHYPNGPLASNHVRKAYPGGAVDVSDPAQLAAVLGSYPRNPKLVWGGPVMGDFVHFSATGHRRGGRVGAQRFATGGVVGNTIFGPGGLTSVGTLNNPGADRILKELPGQLADATYGGVVAMVKRITAQIKQYTADHVVTPREQAQILRLRGAMTIAQTEVGRRLGTQFAGAQAMEQTRDDFSTAFGLHLRRAGIDPSSLQGLRMTGSSLKSRLGDDRREISSLSGIYNRAVKTGDTQLAQTIGAQLKGVVADREETLTEIAENTRATTQAVHDQTMNDNSRSASDLSSGGFLAGLTGPAKDTVAGILAGNGITTLPGGMKVSDVLGSPQGLSSAAQADIGNLMAEVNSGKVTFAEVWPQIEGDLGIIAGATTATAESVQQQTDTLLAYYKQLADQNEQKFKLSEADFRVLAPYSHLPMYDRGGPITSDGPIYGHQGEHVVPRGGTLVLHSGGSQSSPDVHVNVYGDAAGLIKLIRSEIRHPDNVREVSRQMGTRTSQLAGAPGGNR